MPSRATDQRDSPNLDSRKGSELSLSGPALVDLTRAVLDRGCSFRFCARGWSMSPFIRDGDAVTIAPLGCARPGHPATAAGKTCGVGQVLAFVSPGDKRLVVHRLIGRRSSRLLIQGDSMQGPAADVVCPSNVLGRVVRIERGGRDVWLGLGPERYLIAALSRVGLLLPILARAATLTRFLRKRRHEGT